MAFEDNRQPEILLREYKFAAYDISGTFWDLTEHPPQQDLGLASHPQPNPQETVGCATFINELIDEGKVFVQKEDIAQQMNSHFCSLGSRLASCIPDTASQPEDFLGRTDLNFCFRPVNVGYILNLISNVKPSVSCGLDNISSGLLKLFCPYISDSICDIINHVLETGIFPDDWKKAKYILFLSLMKEIFQATIDRFLFYLPFRKSQL